MKKATHQAPVIKLTPEKHPDADVLSIVRINEIDQVVIRTEDWVGIDKAVWIQPQSLVDTDRPEFAWLKKDEKRQVRIKPCKLRGVYSMGCLVKIPDGIELEVGDDASELLGVEHWEPEEKLSTGGEFVNGGKHHSISKYDVDSYAKFKAGDFIEGEDIWVTEKLDGCNVRFYHDGQQFYIGSRTNWFKESNKVVYWKAFYTLSDSAKQWLIDNPFHILYGEGYGQVQGLKYGRKDVGFAAFDIRKPNMTYMDFDDFHTICKTYDISHVPILGIMPFNIEQFKKIAEGKTTIKEADHIKEGIVCHLPKERYTRLGERAIFKIINPAFS